MTIIANVLKGQLYPFDHCHMLEVHKRKTTLHNLYVVFEDNYFKNKQANQPANQQKEPKQTKIPPPTNRKHNIFQNEYFEGLCM